MSMVSSIVGLLEPRRKNVVTPQTFPVFVEELREEGVFIPDRQFRDVARANRNPGTKPILCRGYDPKMTHLTLEEGLDVVRGDVNLQRVNVIVAGTQMRYRGEWRDTMIGPDDEGRGLCVGCAIEREQQGKYLCWK